MRAREAGDIQSALLTNTTPGVLNYIGNQESHYPKVAFRQEFIDLLGKHNIP
jgi:hypothetical protein